MTLKLYHQKRNFKKTPEPKGKITRASKTNGLFIIQKHAASHLHYDFRLELNGVLISWAVPKGPCLDPTVKRLAMHVEDHPVEYGSFEGIIPKGQYGGGTVMLWDQGKWICEDEDPKKAYRDGHLTFTLKAKKLKGRWKLIRIKHDDKTWLLMKIKDDYAIPLKDYDITIEKPNSVISKQSIDEIAENYKKVWHSNKGVKTASKKKLNKLSNIKISLDPSRFPKTAHAQLATLVDKPPQGTQWIHEIKFDGYRLLIFKEKGLVRIFTRNHNDWTSKFKNLVEAVKDIPIANCILDGEVVVLDDNQYSNFQLLQNSMKENENAFIFYAFDLLYFDKFNLMSLDLLERKNILKEIILNQNNSFLRYSDHVFAEGEEVYKKACQLGLEGIISKDARSHYSQIRDKNWLKIKCTHRQEFVIGGFNPSERRAHFRSLLLGTFNKNKELIYNGNVGTGFTQKSLQETYQLLIKHKSNVMPFKKKPPGSRNAVWVKPEIVAEIEFTEWTSGGTLRHPSFKGIRMDKPAKAVKKEVSKKITQPSKKSSKMSKVEFKLTNPDKILYPEGKITKQDIAHYYHEIQQWILPYITQRPLTLVRCPSTYKHCFYQKHIHNPVPRGLYEITIREKEGEDEYLYVKDFAGLLALTQMGALELHPWGSRIDKVEYPDTLIFDLDPAPKLAWKKVVNAAFEIKALLEELKLKAFIKTTGGKGLHVVIPIQPKSTWDEIKTFSHAVVNYLVSNNPTNYVGVMTKSKRTDKIYIDYLRNQRGATSIAPYSIRARKHAPVATPIHWDELTNDIRDTFFTIKTVIKRLELLKKDPWKDYFKIKQSIDLKKFK